MKKIIFILLLLTFQRALSYGQQAVVKGVVRDSLGPIAGVTINEILHPTNMTTTDSAGHFSLQLNILSPKRRKI